MANCLTIVTGAANPDFENPGSYHLRSVCDGTCPLYSWSPLKLLPLKYLTIYSPFCPWSVSLSLGFHLSVWVSSSSLCAHSLSSDPISALPPHALHYSILHITCSLLRLFPIWTQKMPVSLRLPHEAWQKGSCWADNGVASVGGTWVRAEGAQGFF